MIKAFKQYACVPLLLIFFFYLDGVLPLVFLRLTANNHYRMDPAIFLLGLIYFAEKLSDDHTKTLYTTAVVIGLLFDLYYNQIIGIHLFIWPLFVYLTRHVRKLTINHFYSEWLWLIATVFLYMQGMYHLYRLLGLNYFSYGTYFINRFVSSLILNAFLAFIVMAVLNYIVKWIHAD